MPVVQLPEAEAGELCSKPVWAKDRVQGQSGWHWESCLKIKRKKEGWKYRSVVTSLPHHEFNPQLRLNNASINKTLCFLSFTLTLLTSSSINNNRTEVNPNRRTITLVMMQRLCRCLWKHRAQISESDCLHGVRQNSENNMVHSQSVNGISFPPTLMPRDDVLAAIFVGGVRFLLLPFEASEIKPRVSHNWAVHSSHGGIL